MQCYTRKNGLPKHTYGYNYRPIPPLYRQLAARQTPRVNPEVNGRPGCPAARPSRPDVDRPESLYNPRYEAHREDKMAAMLASINEKNWTTSQKACIYKGSKVWPEKGVLSKTFANSIHRLSYKYWDEYKKLDSCRPEEKAASGCIPFPAGYMGSTYVPTHRHEYVYDCSCVTDEVERQWKEKSRMQDCKTEQTRNPKRLKMQPNGPLPKIEERAPKVTEPYTPRVVF